MFIQMVLSSFGQHSVLGPDSERTEAENLVYEP